jgi:hypothetical protein
MSCSNVWLHFPHWAPNEALFMESVYVLVTQNQHFEAKEQQEGRTM